MFGLKKTVSKAMGTATIALGVMAGASAAEAASTIYGEFTADNNMVLAYGADGLPTQIQTANGNPNDWRTTTRYKFEIDERYLKRCSCTVQIVAWGDGRVAEGLIGFLHGDTVVATGSAFKARDTLQLAGGTPSAGQMDIWRNQPHTAPVVGGQLPSLPWLNNSFAFSGNINAARWIWTQANFQSSGTGTNYRSFKIPCSRLVKTSHGDNASYNQPASKASQPIRRLLPTYAK